MIWPSRPFASAMLTQLLREQSLYVRNASVTLAATELLEHLEADRSDSRLHLRRRAIDRDPRPLSLHQLRARFPALKIIVGLWGATERVAEATKRLQDSGADETVTSLAGALKQILDLSAAGEQLAAVSAA